MFLVLLRKICRETNKKIMDFDEDTTRDKKCAMPSRPPHTNRTTNLKTLVEKPQIDFDT